MRLHHFTPLQMTVIAVFPNGLRFNTSALKNFPHLSPLQMVHLMVSDDQWLSSRLTFSEMRRHCFFPFLCAFKNFPHLSPLQMFVHLVDSDDHCGSSRLTFAEIRRHCFKYLLIYIPMCHSCNFHHRNFGCLQDCISVAISVVSVDRLASSRLTFSDMRNQLASSRLRFAEMRKRCFKYLLIYIYLFAIAASSTIVSLAVLKTIAISVFDMAATTRV